MSHPEYSAVHEADTLFDPKEEGRRSAYEAPRARTEFEESKADL